MRRRSDSTETGCKSKRRKNSRKVYSTPCLGHHRGQDLLSKAWLFSNTRRRVDHLSNSSPHGEFPRQSGWRRRATSFVMSMCLAHFAFIRRSSLESRSAGQLIVGCCGRRSGRGEGEGELEQNGAPVDVRIGRPVEHSGSDAGSSMWPRHVSEYAQRRTSSCDHAGRISTSAGVLFLPLSFLLAPGVTRLVKHYRKPSCAWCLVTRVSLRRLKPASDQI
jgi:hypothetical protein